MAELVLQRGLRHHTAPPFDPLIPLEILNDVTFAGKGGKTTTITLRATPHGAEEERSRCSRACFPRSIRATAAPSISWPFL